MRAAAAVALSCLVLAACATNPGLPYATDTIEVANRYPQFIYPMVNPIMLAILAAAAFGFGAIGGRRAAFSTPLFFALLTFIAVVAKQIYSDPDYIDLEWFGTILASATAAAAGLAGALIGRCAAARWTTADITDADFQTDEDIGGDLSRLAATARRLDVSATLRSFVSLYSVLSSLTLLILMAASLLALRNQLGGDSGVGFTWGLVLVAAAALLAPLGLAIFDEMARQPLRIASGVIAVVAGVLTIVFGSLLALLSGIVIYVGAVTLLRGEYHGDFALDDPQIRREVFIYVALLALLTWTTYRSLHIERMLASKAPRPVLLGFLKSARLSRRFAYLFGLPSSMWRAASLSRFSSWLLLASRPMVYVSFGVASFGLDIQRFTTYDSFGWEEQNTSFGWSPYALAAFAVGAALLVLGHAAFAFGKRLAARRIWEPEVTSTNAPAPILFLRSFEDDQLGISRSWLDLPGRWLDLWSFRRNVDEMMIDEFAQLGPVIALGKPGEISAKFGAQRRYASHDDWQELIVDAAARAKAIVVAAGETPGLVWEYDLLRSRGYLEKTIFLFPPFALTSERASKSLARFAEAYPELDPRSRLDGDSLIALTVENGAARPWTAKRPSASAYLVALRRFFLLRERPGALRTASDSPKPPFKHRLRLIGLAAVAMVAVSVIAVGLFAPRRTVTPAFLPPLDQSIIAALAGATMCGGEVDDMLEQCRRDALIAAGATPLSTADADAMLEALRTEWGSEPTGIFNIARSDFALEAVAACDDVTSIEAFDVLRAGLSDHPASLVDVAVLTDLPESSAFRAGVIAAFLAESSGPPDRFSAAPAEWVAAACAGDGQSCSGTKCLVRILVRPLIER